MFANRINEENRPSPPGATSLQRWVTLPCSFSPSSCSDRGPLVDIKFSHGMTFPPRLKIFLSSNSFPSIAICPLLGLFWNLTTRCLAVTGGGIVRTIIRQPSSVDVWTHYTYCYIYLLIWWSVTEVNSQLIENDGELSKQITELYQKHQEIDMWCQSIISVIAPNYGALGHVALRLPTVFFSAHFGTS